MPPAQFLPVRELRSGTKLPHSGRGEILLFRVTAAGEDQHRRWLQLCQRTDLTGSDRPAPESEFVQIAGKLGGVARIVEPQQQSGRPGRRRPDDLTECHHTGFMAIDVDPRRPPIAYCRHLAPLARNERDGGFHRLRIGVLDPPKIKNGVSRTQRKSPEEIIDRFGADTRYVAVEATSAFGPDPDCQRERLRCSPSQRGQILTRQRGIAVEMQGPVEAAVSVGGRHRSHANHFEPVAGGIPTIAVEIPRGQSASRIARKG